MENFIVSARKYRPVNFDTVVGQKSITNTLRNAIKNNQLAQAFLFCGPRGIGKTTCARILAKTINCENLDENIEPCNKCESCVSFNNNASFNIHELDAASNNSVEDIRNLVEKVRIPPQVGEYKVYIIDEVHMLSLAAFNAFLKTLEEPPAYAKFILATTEKHKIIPTILSRCQVFDFRRISVDDIVKHLEFVAKNENVEAEDDALHIIAQKADGAMRDALSIFDQLVSFTGNKLTYEAVIQNLNVLDYDYYFRMCKLILNGDIPASLLLLNEIIKNGFDGQHFLIGMGEHFRNLLVCKNESTVELLEVSQSLKQSYLEQSRSFSIELLLKVLEINNNCDINYKTSNNKILHLELALMQMCSINADIGEEKKNHIIESTKEPSTKFQTNNKDSNSRSQANPKEENYKQAEQSSGVKEIPPELEKPAASTEVPASGIRHPESSDQKAENSNQRPETSNQQPVTSDQKPVTSNQQPVTSDQQPVTSDQQPVTSNQRPKPNGLGNIPGTISIKKAKEENGKKKPAEEAEEDLSGKPATEFSQKKLESVWTLFTESIKKKSPNLYSTLTRNKPELKENFRIELVIDNKVQEREILERKSNIMFFLREELNNYHIQLDTRIEESHEEKKAYLPEEIYQEMVKKNPNIKKLKDELDLELDY